MSRHSYDANAASWSWFKQESTTSIRIPGLNTLKLSALMVALLSESIAMSAVETCMCRIVFTAYCVLKDLV